MLAQCTSAINVPTIRSLGSLPNVPELNSMLFHLHSQIFLGKEMLCDTPDLPSVESGYAGGRSEGEESDRKLARGSLPQGPVRDDGLEPQMPRPRLLSPLQCPGLRFHLWSACVGLWSSLTILTPAGGKVCKLTRSPCSQTSDSWEKFLICGSVSLRSRVHVKRHKIESSTGLPELSRSFTRIPRTGPERVSS